METMTVDRTYDCPKCGKIDIGAKSTWFVLKKIIGHLEKHVKEDSRPLVYEHEMEAYNQAIKLTEEKIDASIGLNKENSFSDTMKSALRDLDAELKIYPEKKEKDEEHE